jgi:predicted nucleic acid-binding Zn ribbon protein
MGLAYKLLKSNAGLMNFKIDQKVSSKRPPMISVEGIIIPSRWDKQGNIVELAIATRNEEEYLVADENQVTKLKPLLRKEAQVRGILQTKDGKKVINVTEFRQKGK